MIYEQLLSLLIILKLLFISLILSALLITIFIALSIESKIPEILIFESISKLSILKDSKLLQFLKVLTIELSLGKLNEDKSISLIDKQFSKVLSKDSILLLSKLPKSTLIKLTQFSKAELRFSISRVIKLDKLIESKYILSLNISYIDFIGFLNLILNDIS